ncbi:SDR family oxidoreductase [Streptomyces fagopyri]|uniref:SDR family oxidoreductase n=1 Tax=Streptomyces fagopyri TaxID=2662397 RepID=UPI0038124953
MKVVVIGGTGLIGSKVVRKLAGHRHEAVPASPDTGVNTLPGEGVAEVLRGAQVVVDVSNSPSFADDDVMEFFRTSTRNLLRAEKEAGVAHHVALSVVGTDRLQESGYFRAKQVREELSSEGLTAGNDPRTVVADPKSPCFGARLRETTLLPGPDARIGTTRFADSAARQQ